MAIANSSYYQSVMTSRARGSRWLRKMPNSKPHLVWKMYRNLPSKRSMYRCSARCPYPLQLWTDCTRHQKLSQGTTSLDVTIRKGKCTFLRNGHIWVKKSWKKIPSYFHFKISCKRTFCSHTDCTTLLRRSFPRKKVNVTIILVSDVTKLWHAFL